MWLKVNDPRSLRPGDYIKYDDDVSRIFYDPNDGRLGTASFSVLNKFGEWYNNEREGRIYRKVESVADARVGDILKDEQGMHSIVLSDKHDVVELGINQRTLEKIKQSHHNCPFSRSELLVTGYRFAELENEETVMTIAELEQKLNIKNLKIKKDEQ